MRGTDDEKEDRDAGLFGRIGRSIRAVADRVAGWVRSEPAESEAPDEGEEASVAAAEEDGTERAEEEEETEEPTRVGYDTVLDEAIDSSPATVVLDAEFLIRLDEGAGGRDLLDAVAETTNAVVPEVVRDEVGLTANDDAFVTVGDLPADGPSAEMEAAWDEGKIAVVSGVPAADVSETLRAEIEDRAADRVNDGRLDLTDWSRESGETEVQSAGETKLRNLVDDEVAELVGIDDAPLRIRARVDHTDELLGAGESGAILLADVLDGTFLSSDWDARDTASSDDLDADIDTAELYATMAELVATDRFDRSRADGLLASLTRRTDSLTGRWPTSRRRS